MNADNNHKEAVRKLINRRVKVSFGLTFLLLFIYLIYVALLSTHADAASTAVSGNINLITFVSLMLIFTGVAVSGFYAWWTNKKHDPQVRKLRQEMDDA